MHWDTIGVVIGVLTACTGVIRWFIRGIVRDENTRQLEKINGTYIRSHGSSVTGAEIVRRLGELDQTLKELHGYTHERMHELANAIQLLVNEEREERHMREERERQHGN